MGDLTTLDAVLEAIGENPHYWNLAHEYLGIEPRPYLIRAKYSDVFEIYHRKKAKLSPSAEMTARKALAFELAFLGVTGIARKYGRERSTVYRTFQRFNFVPQQNSGVRTEKDFLELLTVDTIKALRKHLSGEHAPLEGEIDLTPSDIMNIIYHNEEIRHIVQHAHIHELRRFGGNLSALARVYGTYHQDLRRFFSDLGIPPAVAKSDDYFVFLRS